MALGKAVLGSSVGGIRELIEPEINGLLFQPGSIESFCEQASRLLNQPGLRNSLGEKARQVMVLERDWKFLARRYEAVYEMAIRRGRKNS